jgi:5-methylcytosine-specific restriction endonuclease McrA
VTHTRAFECVSRKKLDRSGERRTTSLHERKKFEVYGGAMDTNTSAPVPYSLEHLSDDEVHSNTRRLVGCSNQLRAALLAHLAEVEARGIHRERACASLGTYCIYELRFSEDEAFRRARASKIARQFPILFEQVAAGEIHLTGILLLGPHLTEENHLEVLARAKHRTKKEILRLVRRLNPLPDVPARVEALGPAPHGIVGNPTWARTIEAHSPEVRELEPGDRPKDWTADSPEDDGPSANQLAIAESDPEPAPPDPVEPQRYKVQFTASQEYVDLLETARDLIAHAVPSRSIEEVHLRAMRALVAELKKKRTGATKESQPETPEALSGAVEKTPSGSNNPRQRGIGEETNPRQRGNQDPINPRQSRAHGSATPRQRGTKDPINPRQRGTHDQVDLRQRGTHDQVDPRQRGAGDSLNPRQRGRSVPRAVRRAVWKRDAARCTYVDASGQRCRETGCLELDHIDPHARGGPPTVENLRLRCRSHNALAAEYVFGRDFMASKMGAEPGLRTDETS